MARHKVYVDGFTHPDFHPVVSTLRDIVGQFGGGAGVCIYHHGEVVADIWAGQRNRAGAPWLSDTMAPSFSTTKGVASTLLHILVDRGLLDYDDRVCDHWPEFAQAGKEHITVRQVLSHQSGLYHIRQMIDHADRMRDWPHMIAAIEKASPIHTPGTHTGYHGLTYGFLVGELVRRVSGQPIPQLVRDLIVRPLGLDGMYIGAPRAVLHRAAELIWPGQSRGLLNLEGTAPGRAILQAAHMVGGLLRPIGLQLDLDSILDSLAPRGIGAFDFGSPDTLRATIPAANGLFTARSLARMYAALAGGGELDGTRLLSRRTLSRATRVQDRTHGRRVIPWDMRWRLGYHGVATTYGIPRRAFGHFGFGGSGAWADPERNLSVGLIVNAGFGTPFGDIRILRIGGAALRCSEKRLDRRPIAAPPERRLRSVPAALGAN